MSSEQLKRAYEFGWLAAASWTLANDIVHDVGSPAYNDERDAKLRTLQSPRVETVRIPVFVETLSVTHICDGQEIVTGGDDGQSWVASFASRMAAEMFVMTVQRMHPGALIYGERVAEIVTPDTLRPARPG